MSATEDLLRTNAAALLDLIEKRRAKLAQDSMAPAWFAPANAVLDIMQSDEFKNLDRLVRGDD